MRAGASEDAQPAARSGEGTFIIHVLATQPCGRAVAGKIMLCGTLIDGAASLRAHPGAWVSGRHEGVSGR
jgi:hypothetical protein